MRHASEPVMSADRPESPGDGTRRPLLARRAMRAWLPFAPCAAQHDPAQGTTGQQQGGAKAMRARAHLVALAWLRSALFGCQDLARVDVQGPAAPG